MRDGAAADGQPAPAKQRPRSGSAGFMVLLAVVSAAALWLVKGGAAVVESAVRESDVFVAVVPTVVTAMLLAGFLQALIPQSAVSQLMGESSGWKGLSIASVAGAITPGGPITSFPLVAALAAAGADYGSVVAYLTAWSCLGLSKMIVWELPFLGTDFAFLRFIVSLPLPFIAGAAARMIARRWTRA